MSPYCSHREVIGFYCGLQRDGERPVWGTSPSTSGFSPFVLKSPQTEHPKCHVSFLTCTKSSKKYSSAYLLLYIIGRVGKRTENYPFRPRHQPCNLLLRTGLGLLQQLLKICRTQTLKGWKQHAGMSEWHQPRRLKELMLHPLIPVQARTVWNTMAYCCRQKFFSIHSGSRATEGNMLPLIVESRGGAGGPDE